MCHNLQRMFIHGWKLSIKSIKLHHCDVLTAISNVSATLSESFPFCCSSGAMKITSSGLSSGMALKDKLPFSLRTNVSGEMYAAKKWKKPYCILHQVLYIFSKSVKLWVPLFRSGSWFYCWKIILAFFNNRSKCLHIYYCHAQLSFTEYLVFHDSLWIHSSIWGKSLNFKGRGEFLLGFLYSRRCFFLRCSAIIPSRHTAHNSSSVSSRLRESRTSFIVRPWSNQQ